MGFRVRTFVAALFVTSCIAAAACGGPTEERPPAADTDSKGGPSTVPTSTTQADASTEGGASSSSSSGGGGKPMNCTTGTQLGQLVKQVAAVDPGPDAVGGTLVPGTYVLTEMRAYNKQPAGTETGLVGKITLDVGDGQWVRIGGDVAGTLSAEQAVAAMTLTVTPAANKVGFGILCPPSAAFPTSMFYTATATEIQLWRNPIELDIYKKQ